MQMINWSSGSDSIVEKQGAKQDLAGQAPGWKSPCVLADILICDFRV
jgi:hypothetical protein